MVSGQQSRLPIDLALIQNYRTNEWYGFTDEQIDWLFEKGYKFEKINLDAGDLVLWESRGQSSSARAKWHVLTLREVPHYNVSPGSDSARMAIYVCYAPVTTANAEELRKKKEAFESGHGTTHWPQTLQVRLTLLHLRFVHY